MNLNDNKKLTIIFAFVIIVIIGLFLGIAVGLSKKNREVTYISDSDYLYDVAIEYLKEKYTQEQSYYNQKEDYQIFFDYKGFGISQKDNIKYAYMWILNESYYVENGKLEIGSGSSMPYKIKFENDKVVTIENPRDGGYYTSSVKDMFPDDIENKILQFHLDNVNIKSKVNEHYSYLNSPDYVPTEATYEFVAEIIEAHENFIIVKPDANSREIKSSDKISVNITRPTNGTNDFYVVGNKVKITYNGDIMTTYPVQIIASKVELVTNETKNYTEKIAYANYSSDNTIISECLNKDKMIISSARHLPVYKFETKNELDEFKNKFKNSFTMDNSYSEIPSFNDVTANYDDEFFKNNTIILAYISANSGSYRYGISEVKKENKTLRLDIIKTNNPEVGTMDMSGWFLMAEFDKDYIKDCTEFDAQLQN